jgi:hypothetical protein
MQYIYTIGLVYWKAGLNAEPFEAIKVSEKNDRDACAKAAGILKPNHLQTLKIMEKTAAK